MSTFGAFSHFALHGGWAARTGECSTICYVKGESALRTFHYMFRLRAHLMSLSLKYSISQILKTFLEVLEKSDDAIVKSIDLNDKTVKSMIEKAYETWLYYKELVWERDAEDR
jgi:hypothetical protein